MNSFRYFLPFIKLGFFYSIFSYYNLDDTDHEVINRYLSQLVEKALLDLESSYCVEIGEVRQYNVHYFEHLHTKKRCKKPNDIIYLVHNLK